MTIYIVSGYRRSGTSMMMGALKAGMTSGAVLYQPGLEKFNQGEGYKPNPDGLWEVGQAYYMRPKFLRIIPDESLVKILYDGLPNLPQKIPYKIIFMTRDEQEIHASCDRVDAHLRYQGVSENPPTNFNFDVFRPYQQIDIDHVLSICDARNDVDLITLPYSDVIERPLDVFSAIKDFGFPLDPSAAAETVKPEFYRLKKEA